MKRFVRKIGRAGIALLTAAALVCIGGGCKIDTEDSPNGKPAIDNPADNGSENDKDTPGNGNGDNNETVNGGGNDSNNGGSTSDNSTENKTDGENGDNTGDANGGNAGDASGSGNGGNTGDTTGDGNGSSTGDASGSGSGDSTGDASGSGSGDSTGDASGSGSGDSTGDASGGGNGGNTDETTGGGSEDTAPAYSLEGLILKGGWEGGDEGGTYILTAEKTQTVSVGGQKTDGTNEFGIYNAARKNVWTGSSIPFGTETELTYIKDGGAPATMESEWQGGDVGISYKITLELKSDDGNNPKLYITVTEISEN